ncbi:MAG: hypothetical protein PVI00_00935 [Desulfobacterales bacterium]|jgi:citrate lyase gamma subunit
MTTSVIKEIMQAVQARYEFRAFAQHFGLAEEKLRKLAKFEKFRESSEIYILSAPNDEHNIKIRYDTLDIKVLVKEEQGLQQWQPKLKVEFPLKKAVIRDEIFPAFNVAAPEFKRPEYSLAQFLQDTTQSHPALSIARVFKRRFGYTIDGCISEIAELTINGAAIKTIAVESLDVQTVLQAREMLGLQEYANVSYLLAIKRIIGMAPLPE